MEKIIAVNQEGVAYLRELESLACNARNAERAERLHRMQVEEENQKLRERIKELEKIVDKREQALNHLQAWHDSHI